MTTTCFDCGYQSNESYLQDKYLSKYSKNLANNSHVISIGILRNKITVCPRNRVRNDMLLIKILQCEQRNIFKVCLVIFQHYT